MSSLISTDVPVTPDFALEGDPTRRRQSQKRTFAPVERVRGRGTTRPSYVEQSRDTVPDLAEAPKRTFEAPQMRELLPVSINANSTPLQIWEGTVVEVNHDSDTMQVLLDAKIGQIPEHTAEIDLEWVDEQDQDLVRPGAVFYLTLFKRTKPSVENVQELRFRRRPAWTASQIERIKHEATKLRSKFRTLPSHDD